MSLATPRSCAAYRLREHSPGAVLGRAGRAIGLALVQYRFGLYGLILGALATFGYAERIAAERDAAQLQAAATEIRMAALADWHRDNTVRISLEGDPRRVANMAQQFANLPQ